MTPLYSPWKPGHPACHERACKHPVLGIFEQRRLPPTQEHFGQGRIKRHARVGVFGFHVAYYAGHNRSPHKEHTIIPEHVTPLQREKLAATETRGEIEDNHRAEGVIELFEQETELIDAKH